MNLILLVFDSNKGYANAPRCHVIPTLPVLSILTLLVLF